MYYLKWTNRTIWNESGCEIFKNDQYVDALFNRSCQIPTTIPPTRDSPLVQQSEDRGLRNAKEVNWPGQQPTTRQFIFHPVIELTECMTHEIWESCDIEEYQIGSKEVFNCAMEAD